MRKFFLCFLFTFITPLISKETDQQKHLSTLHSITYHLSEAKSIEELAILTHQSPASLTHLLHILFRKGFVEEVSFDVFIPLVIQNLVFSSSASRASHLSHPRLSSTELGLDTGKSLMQISGADFEKSQILNPSRCTNTEKGAQLLHALDNHKGWSSVARPLVRGIWQLIVDGIAMAVTAEQMAENDRDVRELCDKLEERQEQRAKDNSNKKKDVYVPDRPLPRDERTNEPTPDTSKPHSQLGIKEGRDGKYPQAREFDAEGKAVRDIDFTDHGRPQEHVNPHQHRYADNITGGTRSRGKAEPLFEENP